MAPHREENSADAQAAPSKRANRGPVVGPENRRALIAAAREVYADGGLNVPFSAVAKRAGVGQGSLYRHFPDRTALAVAVFEENLAQLERFAEESDNSLDDLLDGVVEQAMVSTAFIELLSAQRDDPAVVPLGARFRGVVARLLAREQAAGHASPDLEPEDIELAVAMLAGELSRSTPAARDEVVRRARALFRAAWAPR